MDVKLKTSLPDGGFTVAARFPNASAALNVDVAVVGGFVFTGQEVGAAILSHDKDTNTGMFEYVSDDMPAAPVVEPEAVVEPTAEPEAEAEPEAVVEAEAEPEAEEAPTSGKRRR